MAKHGFKGSTPERLYIYRRRCELQTEALAGTIGYAALPAAMPCQSGFRTGKIG